MLLFEIAADWIWTLWNRNVLAPLYHLYLNGPLLGGFGFWSGAQFGDICAALSGVSAKHWESSAIAATQCQDLIERRAYSFALGALSATGLLLTGYAITSLAHYCFTIRPVLHALSQIVLTSRQQAAKPRKITIMGTRKKPLMISETASASFDEDTAAEN